jgi:serine phosphatase RsbU (regulator of sigma subunit)
MTVGEKPEDEPRLSSEIKGYLEITRRGEPGVRRVPLSDSHLIVGRNPAAQIVLDHSTVSRGHAELVFDPFGRWWVHDLGSTNGTHVNGLQVQERVLSPGDIIDVGDFSLRLHVYTPRSNMDSGFPFPMPRTEVEDDDATMISVLPRSAQAPQINASHLSRVMALGRRLMAIDDPLMRLRILCDFVVGDGFPAESATMIRLREGCAPKILSGPFFRDNDAIRRPPYFSHSVLTTVWETREPVLASNAPSAGAGIRRLSMVGALRQLVVVACPVDTEQSKMDALYVEFPSKYGTVEWLTLVAFAAEAFQQSELAWEVRKHAQAHAFVERELEMARQIQEGLVPKSLRFLGLDVAVGFQPCRWVGGDYVDAVLMPDGRVLLAVADVCGKGLQAALVASSLHTMVRVTADNGGSVHQLMDRLNNYLCNYLPEHSFVTMICIAIDPRTGEVECLNAGHPPAFIVASDGVHQLQSEANIALGMMPTNLVAERSFLAEGEVLCLYTDGLSDRTGVDQEMLGTDRLADGFSSIVCESPHAPVEELCARLTQMLDNFSGSQLAADDSAFLVARRPRSRRALSSRPPGFI